jgi:hypothetical protein
MRVESIRTIRRPPDRIRLEATVRYGDRPRRPERAWFEVSEALADGLDAETGNPFFAAMLPLAVALGQDLEIAAPVDEGLLGSAAQIRARWSEWYGTRTDLAATAPVGSGARSTPPRRVAFFSGGVDSTFTALRGAGRLGASTPTIDELLFVEGFDVRLREARKLEVVRRRVADAARAIGLPLVTIRTNLRETRWKEADWTLLAHGPLLAATALALGRRYGEARIASSVWAGRDAAWGSHPEIVDRLSTATLRVREDGFETDRVPKLRAIAHHPATRQHLRVCWSSSDGGNCGRCRKCVMARTVLDLVAPAGSCPSIPHAPDLLALLRAQAVESGDDRSNMREVHQEALARGNADVAAASAHALTSAPVNDRTTLHRPRSLRPRWWRRLARSLVRAP